MKLSVEPGALHGFDVNKFNPETLPRVSARDFFAAALGQRILGLGPSREPSRAKWRPFTTNSLGYVPRVSAREFFAAAQAVNQAVQTGDPSQPTHSAM